MNVIFVFSSVTAAKRVEKTIAKYGVLSKIIHTPSGLGRSGCSHSVCFDEKHLEIVKKIIFASEVDIQNAYKQVLHNGAYIYKEIGL